MIIVRNELTALEAAIACSKLGLSAVEGLAQKVWDSDPAWGWSHHEVQANLESGSAKRCLEIRERKI